jgi:hypothetical protein
MSAEGSSGTAEGARREGAAGTGSCIDAMKDLNVTCRFIIGQPRTNLLVP